MRAAAILAIPAVTAGILAGAVLGAPKAALRIAFTNNKAIYVIGADGSGLRRVTKSTASDGGIAWSNDGKLLAFTRYFGNKRCNEDQTRGDLFVIGSDAKGERRLTSTGCSFSPPGGLAFAPRGTTLAFADDRGILLAGAAGWKPRLVSDHGLFPSWAPDARQIVDVDGPLVEVLDTATHKTRSLGPGDFATWSHDGKRIACVFTGTQLWTTDPFNRHRKQLVATGRIDSVAWSPGDDRIAYSTSIGLRSTSWVISVNGGKPIKLGAGGFPAWSPDGTTLSLDGPNDTLYLVRADGSNRRRLTKGFGAAWAPR